MEYVSTLAYFSLSVSVILVMIGFYGIFRGRNIIRILLSSEIILNGSILTVFSASFFYPISSLTPVVLSLFSVGMALTEIVVGFAAIVLYYRTKNKLEVSG